MNDEERKEADEFFDTEQATLFGFLRRMGLDSNDAEDVLNSAFAAVCAHWGNIRDGSPRGYLYTSARHEAYKLWRTRRSRPEVPLGEWHAAATGDFAQGVIDHQALRRALGELPPREREAVLLVDYAGFDIAGAAQVMGCAPGTVKGHASRGRARLRPLLDDGTGSGTRTEGTR
jgi:RNA polymerase sigma factor (sigma-70 family)